MHGRSRMARGRRGGVLDRRDVLDIMHGRSRMAIDPRIPTIPGRSMSGFHRPGRQTLLAQGWEGVCVMFPHLIALSAQLINTPSVRPDSLSY